MTSRPLQLAAVMLLAMTLAASAADPTAPAVTPPAGVPSATVVTEPPHPLSGKIYRVSDGTFVPLKTLVDALASTRYVLIGETHGRAAHQDREAFLLSALADRGRYPALALEMLTPDQAKVAEQYRATNPEYAMGLGGTLEWHKTSWPSWSLYAPVFQTALAAKLPFVGAELPDRTDVAAKDVSAAVIASWKGSLEKAHCGLADAARMTELTQLQIRRDQAMALSLVEANQNYSSGALLIAGSAHVRRDRSVPLYLPESSVALAMLEVGAALDAKAYLPESISSGPVFDYIWFTPSETKESTCDRLRSKGLIP
jgi:uncharacterized iron-regulated protein